MGDVMKVYGYKVKFYVRDKQGNLLMNHGIVLKLKNNTGFFLEDDSDGLLNGISTQTKAFVSDGDTGQVEAYMYFKTPEAIKVLNEIVSDDVISITEITFDKNLLSLDFNDTINVGETVDFHIVCTDPNLNGISETIQITVNGTDYDYVQTDDIGNATYTYNNTSIAGSQMISIECINADSQSKELVIEDGTGV